MLSQSGTGWPSSFACISAPQMAITPSRLNFSVGPMYCASSPAAPAGIADQQIGQAEGPAVHRTGGREALVPEADAAGVILDRGLETRLNHVEHGAAS